MVAVYLFKYLIRILADRYDLIIRNGFKLVFAFGDQQIRFVIQVLDSIGSDPSENLSCDRCLGRSAGTSRITAVVDNKEADDDKSSAENKQRYF